MTVHFALFLRMCNARRLLYTRVLIFFTPARAVYLVIILCVLSWCTGHQSVDDIVSFCYDLIYVIIYHARVIILIVIYLNILCVVRSSRGSVNIRRFRSKLAVFEGG